MLHCIASSRQCDGCRTGVATSQAAKTGAAFGFKIGSTRKAQYQGRERKSRKQKYNEILLKGQLNWQGTHGVLESPSSDQPLVCPTCQETGPSTFPSGCCQQRHSKVRAVSLRMGAAPTGRTSLWSLLKQLTMHYFPICPLPLA